jgi:hypothetical protein
MFSFGYFPGVRLSFADVSEPSVRYIFKGLMNVRLSFADVSEPSVRSIFNIIHQSFEDGPDVGEIPKRKHTTYFDFASNLLGCSPACDV